ncbi:hypothetical protein BVU76_23545 [Mycolicibacterium porcinum]|nr:hypothetical protein BVU76_23545 [Mycolicibacterium porcinum]
MVRRGPRRIFRDVRCERVRCVIADANGTIAGLRHTSFWGADCDLTGPTVRIEFDRRILSNHNEAIFVVNVGRDLRIFRIEVCVRAPVVSEIALPWAASHIALLDPLRAADHPLPWNRSNLDDADFWRNALGHWAIAVRVEGSSGCPISRRTGLATEYLLERVDLVLSAIGFGLGFSLRPLLELDGLDGPTRMRRPIRRNHTVQCGGRRFEFCADIGVFGRKCACSHRYVGVVLLGLGLAGFIHARLFGGVTAPVGNRQIVANPEVVGFRFGDRVES